MNKFPRTQDTLDIIDKTARLEVYNPNFVNELGVELRELLKLVPQPKLREYKGVTYHDGMWYLRGISHHNVAELITFSGNNTKYQVKLTDDDFIPLMDLKKNPYEEHDVFENITDEQLNTEYFTRFSDLLEGLSTKRLIAELERRGIVTISSS